MSVLKPHAVVEEWEGGWYTVYVFSSQEECKCFWAGAVADEDHSVSSDGAAVWWDINGGYCVAEKHEEIVRALLDKADPKPGQPWTKRINVR